MNLLVYLLVYPILYLVSLLPFRLLYMLSDVVFFVMYYIVGYRKKTVRNNLNLVFPDKSKEELKRIQKTFYRHLCDMFLEMIKSISIDEKNLIKRFVIKNPEELKRLEAQGKSVIVMYGHYASYEWSVVVVYHISFNGFGIYKKLKNPYFDRLVKRIRSKYNTELISTKDAVSRITDLEKQGIKSMTAFLSDQSPKRSKAQKWFSFMGMEVPSFIGAENLAKKLDLAVTYLKINKVKRGYYEAEFVSITDDANTVEDFGITERFNNLLEEQIKAAPEFYLWTHKRWKHRKENIS